MARQCISMQGVIPTREEGAEMIQESGGIVNRIDSAHEAGGVSTHTYDHINYTTAGGAKATVKVKD